MSRAKASATREAKLADIARVTFKLLYAHDASGVESMFEALAWNISRGCDKDSEAIAVGMTAFAKVVPPWLLDVLHAEALKQDKVHDECVAETIAENAQMVLKAAGGAA